MKRGRMLALMPRCAYGTRGSLLVLWRTKGKSLSARRARILYSVARRSRSGIAKRL